MEEKKGKYLGIGIFFGLVIGIIISLVAFIWAPGLVNKIRVSNSKKLISGDVGTKVELLTKIIEANYYQDVDRTELTEGLYKGLFDAIGDKYSAYYSADEYDKLMTATSSTFYGIGVVLTKADNGYVQILSVYDDTPASEVGLMPEDYLVSADGFESVDLSLDEFITHVKGAEGSYVHLKIFRPSLNDYMEFDVVRAQVAIPTVAGEMINDNVGYIRIAEFGSNSKKEFDGELARLQEEGMTKLIIDLRSNPGGMVPTVVSILDEILPEGDVLSTREKNGYSQVYSSDKACLNYPLAVLINGSSASASEIMAGAIRDFEYGTLIGTNTYGKGIVQSIRKLSDGSAYKLTTAEYFTPNGENIHGVGIAPDIELEYEYIDDETIENEFYRDNQVLKALEVLGE